MGGFFSNAASHWWIILLIVLLVFGATKLPQLARGVGQSINILKKEVKNEPGDTADADVTTTTSTTDQK